MVKKIIKQLLPTYVIWYLASKKEAYQLLKRRIVKSNRLFIAIDLCFSKKYYYEHKSHLEGSYQYRKAVINGSLNLSFLRRNIHRIEKGMLMKPRREVFAIRFILQTVKSFASLVENNKFDRSEYEWAYQVLSSYFNMVQSDHTNYENAKRLFNEQLDKLPEKSEVEKVPFVVNKNSLISYEEFYKLNQVRKSVRWFENREVSKEIIDKALEIASLAPSSCNRMPYRYVISHKNSDLIKEISAISAGTVGWNENIPAIAVVIGKQRTFNELANRHSIYVDSTLSIMPFVLALETMGVSTCLINWADIPSRNSRMKKALSLADDESVILSIAMGYADETGKVAYSQRKYKQEISQYLD